LLKTPAIIPSTEFRGVRGDPVKPAHEHRSSSASSCPWPARIPKFLDRPCPRQTLELSYPSLGEIEKHPSRWRLVLRAPVLARKMHSQGFRTNRSTGVLAAISCVRARPIVSFARITLDRNSKGLEVAYERRRLTAPQSDRRRHRGGSMDSMGVGPATG